ncbi:hypothetical protein [Bacteroides mediterraneensis]|uniref:hypothetical protein n=1 Tax=Bacteroides mediterraneensis TaxID=1841856 RepID=UPI001958B036|nr:hypothetical protein [Bacteroides mediterraneensis]MBM6782036.1 hypothetical protein [Bacteroides mediterraneensis]
MKFLKTIIYGLITLCFGSSLRAQTVKQIEVAENAPYVDHISLKPGATDMDLLVKINFDEPNNRLIVSLISYRKLFAFQENVRYSHVVRFNKLRPNKLPYVAESDEKAKYKITRSLRKSIKPKRKHIFKSWIKYEGLQPQPTEYKIVNDYIEQTFDILHKAADVSITLRDILVMNEQINQKKKKYDLFFQTDLDRTYHISIKRDPCFGKEDAIQTTKNQAENIRTAFMALKQKFGPDSQLNTSESEKIFNEMKALLLKQYPKKEETNTCPDIQTNIETYNSYVDAIQNMQCKFQIIKEKQHVMLEISAEYILSMARKIDNSTNKWLLSSDDIEKSDIEATCNQIIDSIDTHVQQATDISHSQQEALAIFNKAKIYFRQTCLNK